MAWRFLGLSRRAFLKATGYGSSGLTLPIPISLMSKQDSGHSTDGEEVSHSICNFCPSLCNLRVNTRICNGVKRIVNLDVNPHSTLNRGKICALGQSGLRHYFLAAGVYSFPW